MQTRASMLCPPAPRGADAPRLDPHTVHAKRGSDLGPSAQRRRAQVGVELGAVDHRDLLLARRERDGAAGWGHNRTGRGAIHDQALRELEQPRDLVGDHPGAVRRHPEPRVLLQYGDVEALLGKEHGGVQARGPGTHHHYVEHALPMPAPLGATTVVAFTVRRRGSLEARNGMTPILGEVRARRAIVEGPRGVSPLRATLYMISPACEL